MEIILELAHKELIQCIQFVTDNWRKLLQVGLGNVPWFASIDQIKSLYEKSTPTVRQVLSLITAEPNTNAQRDALSYLNGTFVGWMTKNLQSFFDFALVHR